MPFVRMSRGGGLFTRAVSVLVAITFIFSSISFAIPEERKTAAPTHQELVTNPEKIVVPRELGLVKSKFIGNEGRLVVHIQDAHCNYEAQSNIAKMLENLVKNYNITLVSVEGADGYLDTSWFKSFPDEDVRREVADYFMKKGEITGPEFISITTDLPVKLFGAETRSYYIDNLNAFTSSYPLKEDTEKYFNGIKAVLNRLKGFIYSEDLKVLDTKMHDYESKKLPFNEYIRYLESMAEKHRINLRQYDNLFKLISALIYEKRIDFNVVDKERGSLIDELSKKMDKDVLTELVTKSLTFKSGKISSAEFYAYLKGLAVKYGLDIQKDYPNLYNYIIYNAVYSRIENEKLFQDIKNIENSIKEKLFTNDDQRTLEKLSRHIEILIGLVNIKLMNGDFEYYEANKGGFTHEAFTDFMKAKSGQFGLAYEIEPPAEAVAKAIPKLEDFYRIAIKRDNALVDNTVNAMRKEKQDVAVLITGGFHSDGITKLLEKSGISYMVVCPSITKDVPSPYIQILTNQRTPLEDILTSGTETKKGLVSAWRIAQLVMMKVEELGAVNAAVAPVNGKGIEERLGTFEADFAALSGYINRVVGDIMAEENLAQLALSHRTPADAKRAAVEQVKRQCEKIDAPPAERALITEKVVAVLTERLAGLDSQDFDALRAKAAAEAKRTGKATRSPGDGAAKLNDINKRYNDAQRQAVDEFISRLAPGARAEKINVGETTGTFLILDDSDNAKYEALISEIAAKHGIDEDILRSLHCHPGTWQSRLVYEKAVQVDEMQKGRSLTIEERRQKYIDMVNAKRPLVTPRYYVRKSTYEKLTPAERLILARHEEGHIRIALGVDNLPDGVDEERFINSRQDSDIRHLFARLGSVEHMLDYLISDTRYGNSIIQEIRDLRVANKLAELEALVKNEYWKRRNIDAGRDILKAGYTGYDVMVIIHFSQEQADLIKQRLDAIFKGKVRVYAVAEDFGGQLKDYAVAMGKVLEMDKALRGQMERNEVKVAVYNIGGKARRFSPETQAFNDDRTEQATGGTLRSADGSDIETDLLLSAIADTRGFANTNGGSRVDTYWVSQLIAFGTPYAQVRRDNCPFDKFMVEETRDANGDFNPRWVYSFGQLLSTPDGLVCLANRANSAAEYVNGQYVIGTSEAKQARYRMMKEAERVGADFGSFSTNHAMTLAWIDFWTKKAAAGHSEKRDLEPGFTQPLSMLLVAVRALQEKGEPVPDSVDAVLKRLDEMRQDPYAKYATLAEKIYPRLNTPEGRETIEFFLINKGNQQLFGNLEKVVGLIGLGTDKEAEWETFRSPIDAANNQLAMLSDIGGMKLSLETNGSISANPASPADMRYAENARRRRGIEADAVCSFTFMGRTIRLSIEDVRGGVFINLQGAKKPQASEPSAREASNGIWIKNSIVQGGELLPGSVIENSFLYRSSGLIEAKGSVILLSSVHHFKGVVNSKLVKVVERGGAETIAPEAGSLIVHIYRGKTNELHGRSGEVLHARFILPIGYDPERVVEERQVAGKTVKITTDDVTLDTTGRYSLAEMRDAKFSKAENDKFEEAERAKSESAISRTPPTRTASFIERTKKLFLSMFGTSGVRDRAGNLPSGKVNTLGKAFFSFFRAHRETGVIAIARDLRPSSNRIARSLIIAMLEAGFTRDQIVNLGQTSTPACSYYGMNRPNLLASVLMITASHNPVKATQAEIDKYLPQFLPLYGGNRDAAIAAIDTMIVEQNGIKGVLGLAGEVLKEHELEILNTALMLIHLENMKPRPISAFDAEGNDKVEGLTPAQMARAREADEILAAMNAEMQRQEEMYVSRYLDTLGAIFDENDRAAFIEHMSVARDTIPKVLRGLGLTGLSLPLRQKDWVRGFIMDTEDVSDLIKKTMADIAEAERKKGAPGREFRGLFATDGDSDRPAIFDENGKFIYGDKVGYLACESIARLKSVKGKKLFIATTASVSDNVCDMLRNLTDYTEAKLEVEVVKTEIGSPYIVKAIQDRRTAAQAAGEDIVCMGFERNGGFLLGSDIRFDNGKVMKELLTRDAMLPIAMILKLAKMEDEKRTDGKRTTLGELVNSRFKGSFASYVDSGLIDNTTKGCEDYTPALGLALIRSLSPLNLDIVEVEFTDEGVRYKLRGEGADVWHPADAELRDSMLKVKGYLESQFGPDKLFAPISRLNFLDGVRIIFAKKSESEPAEVVHMRPSGNEPKLRIYTEAKKQERAEQMTGYRLTVYPALIGDYLVEAQKFAGWRIDPQSNADMQALFAGVKDKQFRYPQGAPRWDLWTLKFFSEGGGREHTVRTFIDFAPDDSSIAFSQVITYDISGDSVEKWLATDGYNKDKIAVRYTVRWNRPTAANGNVSTLTCEEVWGVPSDDGRDIKTPDSRRASVIDTFTGRDAWLQLGRGLAKNIPMGKVQNMPFPIISDKALKFFEEQGVRWLSLFHAGTESQITSQAAMWQRYGLRFSKPAASASQFTTRTPGTGAAKATLDEVFNNIGAAVALMVDERNPEELLRQLAAVAPAERPAFFAQVANDLNAEYTRMYVAFQQNNGQVGLAELTRFREALERFYKIMILNAVTEEGATPATAQAQQTIAGQALLNLYSIESGINNAGQFRLTAAKDEMLNPTSPVPSYLSAQALTNAGVTPTETVDTEGAYWRRFETWASKLKDNNTIPYAVSQANENAVNNIVMYVMRHGLEPVPVALKAMTAAGQISTYHQTITLHERLPASVQCVSNGAGHFQGAAVDVKYVWRGKLLQMTNIYNKEGELVEVVANIVNEGEWTKVVPGGVDYFYPLSPIVEFDDFTIKINNVETINALNPALKLSSLGELDTLKKAVDQKNQAPYIAIRLGGRPVLIPTPALAPNFKNLNWVGNYRNPAEVFGARNILELYRNHLTPEAIPGLLARMAQPTAAPSERLDIVTLTGEDLAKLAATTQEASAIASAAQPVAANPVEADKTTHVIQEYKWGGEVLARFLKWAVRPIAEIWYFCTHKDGLTKIPGTEVTFGQVVEANPAGMLGFERTASGIFAKILSKDQNQPQIVHIGFNEKINEIGRAQFISWVKEERGLVVELNSQLTTLGLTEDQFKIYNAAYQEWVRQQILAKWANPNIVPEAAKMPAGLNMSIFEKIRQVRQNIVSVMNEIELKPGQTIISPVGYIHSIVGSHQMHPPSTHPEAKNEAWYIFAAEGGLLYYEPQQTSNTTYSPFDFPTPIVWNEGKNAPALRKNLASGLNALLAPGEAAPANENEAIDIMMRALKFEPSKAEDFLISNRAEDVTGKGLYEVTGKARVESLIEGTYPVWEEPLFTLHRMTFTPEAREPAVLTVLPAHDTAYRLTVLNGEVEITYGKETRVLKQGGYAFVPAAYRDKIQLKASANAEVMRLYEPSTSEALLYAGYDVRRNDVERIRVEAETRKAGQLEPLQVHLLVSKKAFISKPNISYDGPGSYSYERGLLKELSSGGIDITAVEDTNTDILTGNLLDMLSKKKAGVSYVVQLTKDEWNALKQRGEIATALAGTKIMALPELPARRARGLPFIREIEAGGVRLGLTDINALNDPTSSDTLALKAIMARLTGNRDITADMLRDLFATPNENPDPGAFAERIQRLIRSLLITMPARAYETDKELEGRRKLLWSV